MNNFDQVAEYQNGFQLAFSQIPEFEAFEGPFLSWLVASICLEICWLSSIANAEADVPSAIAARSVWIVIPYVCQVA